MHFNSFNEAADAVKHFIHAGEGDFNKHACALFRLQSKRVLPLNKLCKAQKMYSDEVANWQDIPTLPTGSFGEFDITSLHPKKRTAVFHSSGTTRSIPSKHWHNDESLSIYEEALKASFQIHMNTEGIWVGDFLSLTPSYVEAPFSSLAYMSATVPCPNVQFAGANSSDGWQIDTDIANSACINAVEQQKPIIIIGAAFSFVLWLDKLNVKLHLPSGSRVMETGGYKGRSREMLKVELHKMISKKLGISREWIVCEYGMCELGSQAYDTVAGSSFDRCFRFPSWARAQIINADTGALVKDGEAGLLRIFDLTNVRSVVGVQTQDLAIRRGDGFELIGRVTQANPRGCSLALSEVT